MATDCCLLAARLHYCLCSSQTLPFLNIWSNLRKEFASVNPDQPIKTRRFQVQWLRSEMNCAWWKGNFVQWRNLYPEISHITGVRDHLEKLNFQKGEFKHFFKQHACHHRAWRTEQRATVSERCNNKSCPARRAARASLRAVTGLSTAYAWPYSV